MKKIFPIIILFLFTLSCSKNITDMNVDQKRPGEVPPETLFSNAQKSLSDVVTSSNVNLNVFRLLSQFWTETTYTDESRYNLATRNIPQNFWNAIYRDVLRDLMDAKTLIKNATGVLDSTERPNQLAQITVMEVYAWSILVNTYGNVPYKEALDYTNVTPKYDDAREIYNDLLKRLDSAITDFDTDGVGFGDADLLYGGDIAKWTRFANSLKLRMGMMLADVDLPTAKTIVEAAAPNVFKSNSDNAIFQYMNAPPNTNPIWVDLVQSGRKDFVAANTIVDKLNQLQDPRRPFYFSTTAGNTYNGGVYGSSNSYATFSKPSAKILEPDFEAILMDYSEVEFLLAEAVERGMNVGGSAKEHYDKAVTASILYWGGSAQDAATYLANPAVNYNTAAGNFKQKIGTQKWIALYNRGLDAWIEWRRLNAPTLNVPAGLQYSDIPVRFTYPVAEQNLNKANYEAASTAIGGDLVTTRLFWDIE